MTSKEMYSESIYKIQLQGELDPEWKSWFTGLEFSRDSTGQPPSDTTLVARVSDQAALRGILCKLWDLNLTLISLQRIEELDKGV